MQSVKCTNLRNLVWFPCSETDCLEWIFCMHIVANRSISTGDIVNPPICLAKIHLDDYLLDSKNFTNLHDFVHLIRQIYSWIGIGLLLLPSIGNILASVVEMVSSFWNSL